LILGSKHIFFDDAACPIPDVTLIPELNAEFILVHRYRKASKAIYSILSVSSLLRERIRGLSSTGFRTKKSGKSRPTWCRRF